jgi:hypothetical protein
VGVDIDYPALEKWDELQDHAVNTGMSVYPHEGSVALVDGIIVVIFSFFGRIDVESADTPGIYTATAHHTGKASDLQFDYEWYIYRDDHRLEMIMGDEQVVHEFAIPGSYQFRLLLNFPDGRNITSFVSPVIVVE